MMRITEEQRRIEGREVRTEFVIRALECRPGRVEDESAQYDENGNRCRPPGIASLHLTEVAAWQCGRCFRHAEKLLRRTEGSRITDHGSRITDHGSRITDHGSRITDHGSRITDHGSRITEKRVKLR